MRIWPSGKEMIRVWHYLTEAKRLAFEDVAKYYADPEFANVPTEWLLSEAYGKARFDLIDPKRPCCSLSPATPNWRLLETPLI